LQRAAAAAGVACVVLLAAWRAAVDLDPASLWLDDLWVVALSQSGSWSELSASPSSAPVGFKLLVALAAAIGGDLEVAVQAVAFLSGLVAIAALGWLAFRLTASPYVAVCAAAWLGLDPVFLLHLARVKPYALDALAVVAQGLAFCALLEGYSRRRLWSFAATALLGLFFSALSVFPALAAVVVGGCVLWARGVRDVHALAAGFLVLAAIAEASALSAGAAGANELRGYWQRHYLPTRDAASFVAGVGRWLGSWGDRLLHDTKLHQGWLPLPGALALPLALAGGLELWLAGHRAQLAVGVLLVAAVVAASSLQLLPLGVPRVETFLLPFAALLLASAAGLGARLRDRRLALAAGGLLPALCALQLPSARAPGYPVQAAAPVVEALAREHRAGDGLWSNLLGTFALAVYGPWPVSYHSNDRLGIPHAAPRIDHFGLIDEAGAGTVGSPPDADRVFVFVCSESVDLLEAAAATLRESGYVERGRARKQRCQLERYER
jgi:hypothetical protein